jgi:hypothetical protein
MTHVRPARPDDVPALGRLGALMVTTHHAFDPKRFIAAGSHTEEGYGSFLACNCTSGTASFSLPSTRTR